MKFISQAIRDELILAADDFESIQLWVTISKALTKSSSSTSTGFSWSIRIVIIPYDSNKFVLIDVSDWNPCCLGDKILFVVKYFSNES